jgi:SAM-dependent methyltransferase
LLPKPDHLAPEFGAQFADPSVVSSYHLRPPYPPEVIDILVGLAVDEPRAVLEAGCGRGEMARALAPRVARVDAVDPSPGMLAKGRAMPGGDAPNLTWIQGFAEDAPLRPPYALIVAAASLHWMDWAVVLPRFRDALTRSGVLALVHVREGPLPWNDTIGEVITRHSTNRTFRPYDLVGELEQRDLFHPTGRQETVAIPFAQPVAAYVESFHARNGLSRDRLSPEAASAFDREMTALIAPHAPDGLAHLEVTGVVTWGRPS